MINSSIVEKKKICLYYTILHYSEVQREEIDRSSLQDTMSVLNNAMSPGDMFTSVSKRLGFSKCNMYSNINDSTFPCIVHDEINEWFVLLGKKDNNYIIKKFNSESNEYEEKSVAFFSKPCFFTFVPSKVTRLLGVADLAKNVILSQKKKLIAVFLAGLTVNTLALAVSFYTMQVYDRVVPTSAHQTLMVLTLGVLVAIIYEFMGKRIRARIYESLIEHVDEELSSAVYKKFVSLRIDQLPQSVGSLASQIRGYESVRSYLGTLSNNVIVDFPFVIIFLITIAFIGKWIVIIPIIFLIVLLVIGLKAKNKINFFAEKSAEYNHRKVGLLVESVQGAEHIKAGNGRWRMYNQWTSVNKDSRLYDQLIKRTTDDTQHIVTTGHQIAYISIIASGALLIHQSELTLGALIAISILTSRVLTPVGSIPNLLIQQAYCKSGIKGLNTLWELESDNHGIKNPVVKNKLRGNYNLRNVSYTKNESLILKIKSLNITNGEKIAIIGPIGAGKTTFLSLLTGLVKPTEGNIYLDDIDMQHISRTSISEKVAYMQQDARLFSGTLRENLVLGLIDPGDDAIIETSKKTGLLKHVIKRHHMGLDQPIYEGGSGLSSGQKQLVHLTHAFLKNPSIYILDEPTSSMDRLLEKDTINLINGTLTKEDTLILVTHKMELLPLVDRVIVFYNGNVVMDGPTDEVTKKLTN